MAKKLKAFVRFDGSGRIVPSSLILAANKPKVGNWKETTAYECCNPILEDFLLLENGGNLLQEDNSNIII